MKQTGITEFLSLATQHPILDVRTPAEFAAGHIPGARNLPLFSNEERAIIGTLYKKEGKDTAIKKGLEFIGPRMKTLVEEAEEIAPDKTLLLHCWRGGMRSGSLAWLLDLCGFQVYVLTGGYKVFRHWVSKSFQKPKKILILGGYTGSAKTAILREMAVQGTKMIDLEGLACHKGSAFGSIGEASPPSQEQFENLLAMQWHGIPEDKILWLEDEGRTIGRKVLPEPLWQQMRTSPMIFLEISQDSRVKYLVEEYGKYTVEELAASIIRVRKRLGGLATQQALTALIEGNLDIAARILLDYYDKTYLHGLKKREDIKVKKLITEGNTIEEIALELMGLESEMTKNID